MFFSFLFFFFSLMQDLGNLIRYILVVKERKKKLKKTNLPSGECRQERVVACDQELNTRSAILKFNFINNSHPRLSFRLSWSTDRRMLAWPRLRSQRLVRAWEPLQWIVPDGFQVRTQSKVWPPPFLKWTLYLHWWLRRLAPSTHAWSVPQSQWCLWSISTLLISDWTNSKLGKRPTWHHGWIRGDKFFGRTTFEQSPLPRRFQSARCEEGAEVCQGQGSGVGQRPQGTRKRRR